MRIKSLAKDIYDSGIKHVFGIPGSGYTLSLIDELEKLGIEFILNHFEGSSSLMAGTYGMLSNNLGVSISIKGPGLTNAIPGIAASYFESFPLIHIAESFDQNSPLSMAHKRVNQKSLIQDITKGAYDLSEVGEGFKGCAKIAMDETPGPVLLQLSNQPLNPIFELSTINQFDEFTLEVSKEIENSKNTVVIIGSIGIRKNLKDKLSNLKIPVFSTASAKGVFDEYSEYSAGVYTGVGLSLTPEFQIIKDADLIICFGLTAREVLLCKPFLCKSINIEVNYTSGIDGFQFDWRLNWNHHEEIIDLLNLKNQEINHLKLVKSKLEQILNDDFLPGYVFSFLNKFVNERIVLDTGYFCTIAEHSIKKNSIYGCILSGQSRYMGTSIPMAIASLIFDPSKPVIAVAGDGGIGMYISELKLVVEKKLPLLLILMSDGTFGSIRTSSIKNNLTQKPLIIKQNSWIKILSSFGFYTSTAYNVNEFELFFKDFNFNNGPTYLELNFDKEKYQKMILDIR